MRAAVVVSIASAFANIARADELAEARRLEAELEYDKALAVVRAALAKGTATPARYVELELLAGRLAAGLDRAADAEQHFVRVLALRPDTRLPDGTSPKLVEPFDRARARSRPFTATISIVRGLVTVTVDDAFAIASGVAIHTVDARGGHADIVIRSALRTALPAGREAVEIAILDRHGNRIWSERAPADVGGVVGPPGERPATPSSSAPSPIARWSTWAVIGGVALTGASIASWRFAVAQREWDRLHGEGGHDFSELRAIETRGERWGLAANIGFVVTGGAAITAAILYLGTRHDRDVTVSIGPTGAAVAGRF